MKYSYVIFNPAHSKEVPIRVFDNYHELVCYIRKNSIDSFEIFRFETNDWMDSEIEISQSVYQDAWNGFVHYKDKNYE